MFWFIMYVNESIESTHRERVRFQGSNFVNFSLSKNNIFPAASDLELILFPLWYWPVMNAHTKQQQDKVFQTDFIDSLKSDPPFAHLLALSHYPTSLDFFHSKIKALKKNIYPKSEMPSSKCQVLLGCPHDNQFRKMSSLNHQRWSSVYLLGCPG